MNKEDDFQSALILAGGKSSRMGFDKQNLRIKEEILIYKNIRKLKSIFKEVIVVTKTPQYYKGLCDLILKDEIKDIGPLGGIHVGLKHCRSKYLMIMACDMPIVDKEYLSHLKSVAINNNYKALIGEKEGYLEPFPGFYSKDLIGYIEKNLSIGKKAIKNVFQDNYIYIEKDFSRFNENTFVNLNTVEDVEIYNKNIN